MEVVDSRQEKSSHRILSLFRKQNLEQKPLLYRTENSILEIQSQEEKGKPIKMCKNQGKMGELMTSCIDFNEIEDLSKVFAKLQTHFNRKQEKLNYKKEKIVHLEENTNNLQNSYLLNYINFGKVQETYLKNERKKEKDKKYINANNITNHHHSKTVTQNFYEKPHQDNNFKIASTYYSNKNSPQHVKNKSNPYIQQQYLDNSGNINKTITNFENIKTQLVKNSKNRDQYKIFIEKSYKELKYSSAVQTPIFQEKYNKSASLTMRTPNQSFRKRFENNNFLGTNQDNLENAYKQKFQRDTENYERKTIISMLTGRPQDPYIKLDSLNYKLQIKNDKDNTIYNKQQLQLQEIRKFQVNILNNQIQKKKIFKELEGLNFNKQDMFDAHNFKTPKVTLEKSILAKRIAKGITERQEHFNSQRRNRQPISNYSSKIENNNKPIKLIQLVSNHSEEENEDRGKILDFQHNLNKVKDFFGGESKKKNKSVHETNFLKLNKEKKIAKFNKLVNQTLKHEKNVINQCINYFEIKKQKNDELTQFCATAQRDRALTKDIRMEKYISHFEKQSFSFKGGKHKLDKMREQAETERKKRANSNIKQIDWYKDLVNRISNLVNIQKDNLETVTYIIDKIKLILEDMQVFCDFHFLKILEDVEADDRFEINDVTLYLIKSIMSIFDYTFENLKQFPKIFKFFEKLRIREQNQIFEEIYKLFIKIKVAKKEEQSIFVDQIWKQLFQCRNLSKKNYNHQNNQQQQQRDHQFIALEQKFGAKIIQDLFNILQNDFKTSQEVSCFLTEHTLAQKIPLDNQTQSKEQQKQIILNDFIQFLNQNTFNYQQIDSNNAGSHQKTNNEQNQQIQKKNKQNLVIQTQFTTIDTQKNSQMTQK